jgi:UDP-N-acetylglucosamine--N-acetylmuramyl-(pentapeptide) pyrophosphoryl-undecaprenol N-acetylglucosamine transferase
LRIPIILYSLDAVPGKAIRFLTPFATSIITPFASSQKYFPQDKSAIVPYPIKYQNMQHLPDQKAALHALGLSQEKKTVLILGGSQGSLFLNSCMKQFINDSACNPETIQIIHQTGALDATDWENFYQKNNISAYVFSYMPNLENMYSAADVIICRAGAGTLFEVKFFNKQCIIIPLETNTTTHQVDNAQAMSSEYPELFTTLYQKEIEQNTTLLFQKINLSLFHPHSLQSSYSKEDKLDQAH